MLYLFVICGITALLTVVALLKARSVKSQADFMVAGRKLPWTVLVFTLLSSWIGAGSLFAGGENAYRNGFVALWQPAGGWAGLIVISLIAARARRFAQFTVPDLLEVRYNATARVLATIAIVLSYTMITSYQFKGGGDILHLIFPELDRTVGMYIVAGFVILFTAAAGMASVAYLDLIIGSLVSIIVVVSLPMVVSHAGGWESVRSHLPASHFQVLGDLSFAQAFGFLLPTMLLLIGNQSMYQKFFSARSERDAKLAVAGWIVGTLILETCLITVAVAGSAQFKTDHPREIIPMTARLGLPHVIGALLLGGVFAKIISTANNYLFSPASNLIHDVYLRFIDRKASQRKSLIVSRIVVVLLGVFALLQGAYFESILAAALYAYTIYGAAITPSVLAVFFWRRATTVGAITSIILGTAITVGWNLMGKEDAIYPALAASAISLIVVSLMTKAPTQETVTRFYEEPVTPEL